MGRKEERQGVRGERKIGKGIRWRKYEREG